MWESAPASLFAVYTGLQVNMWGENRLLGHFSAQLFAGIGKMCYFCNG
jgi:hypothetical protein